jgi:hypothetical protein
MKVTVSAIKADIGAIGGHTRPSDELLASVKGFVKKNSKNLDSHSWSRQRKDSQTGLGSIYYWYQNSKGAGIVWCRPGSLERCILR